MCSFICTTWGVWRLRNEAIYASKPQTIDICRLSCKKEMDSCKIRRMARGFDPTAPRQIVQVTNEQRHIEVSPFTCFVDGSWDQDGRAGVGLCLLHNGEVAHWISKLVQAVNPAHAEAKAVLEGYHQLEVRTGEWALYFQTLLRV